MGSVGLLILFALVGAFICCEGAVGGWSDRVRRARDHPVHRHAGRAGAAGCDVDVHVGVRQGGDTGAEPAEASRPEPAVAGGEPGRQRSGPQVRLQGQAGQERGGPACGGAVWAGRSELSTACLPVKGAARSLRDSPGGLPLTTPCQPRGGSFPALGVSCRPRRCPGRGPSGGLRPAWTPPAGGWCWPRSRSDADAGQDAGGGSVSGGPVRGVAVSAAAWRAGS